MLGIGQKFDYWYRFPMDEKFTDFSPAEIEAMRYAYGQMLEGFSQRQISRIEKRELASSILEALGRPLTKEAVQQVLMLMDKGSP